MSGRHAHHNRQPAASADTEQFVAGLVRDLDLRDQDRRGLIRWEAARQERDTELLFEEADYRDKLWTQVSPDQRYYLTNEQLGPGLTRLVESLHHTIPFDGAEAVWVHDERLGAHSSPKLMVNVYLHDQENAPLLRSRVMFSSDAPPGTDVSTLSPADFDPNILLHERWGHNEEASLYKVTPHQLTPA